MPIASDLRCSVQQVRKPKITQLVVQKTPPKMVGPARLELATSPLSGVRSNQLSYKPIRMVELSRIELLTS